MSIIEYTGPSNPQEIRKYLMRRTKEEIVWEYLRQWREYGELEKERDALATQRDEAVRTATEAQDIALEALDERDALAAKVIEKCEQLKYRDSAQRRYNLALGDIQAYMETLTTANSLSRIKAECQIELLDRLAADCIGGLEAFELEAEANRIREQHGLPLKDYDNDEDQETR